MSLTDKQKNVLRLLRRSTPVNGWYKVSDTVWPIVDSAMMPADLVEVRLIDGAHEICLTSAGEAVIKYLV